MQRYRYPACCPFTFKACFCRLPKPLLQLLLDFTFGEVAPLQVGVSDFPSPGGFDRRVGAASASALEPPRMKVWAQDSSRHNMNTCRILRTSNKACAWLCCAAAFHAGRPVTARLCGDDGCHSPAPHGVGCKVGGKQKRMPWCLEEDGQMLLPWSGHQLLDECKLLHLIKHRSQQEEHHCRKILMLFARALL